MKNVSTEEMVREAMRRNSLKEYFRKYYCEINQSNIHLLPSLSLLMTGRGGIRNIKSDVLLSGKVYLTFDNELQYCKDENLFSNRYMEIALRDVCRAYNIID